MMLCLVFSRRPRKIELTPIRDSSNDAFILQDLSTCGSSNSRQVSIDRRQKDIPHSLITPKLPGRTCGVSALDEAQIQRFTDHCDEFVEHVVNTVQRRMFTWKWSRFSADRKVPPQPCQVSSCALIYKRGDSRQLLLSSLGTVMASVSRLLPAFRLVAAPRSQIWNAGARRAFSAQPSCWSMPDR